MKEKYIKICIICLIMFLCMNQYEVLAVTGTALSSAGGTLATGSYYLNSDVTLSTNIAIPSGAEVVLDLNGYVLKHTNSERHFVISTGGKITIIDSNPTRSHYGTVSDGLWTYNSSATSGVEIKGGVITGGLKSDRGGAFFNAGTLIIEGGTIAGCKAISNGNANENDMENYPVNTITNGVGGAVFINDTATFTMNGGAIMYCKAGISSSVGASGGGAVFVDANANNIATFTMNDGIISNCSAPCGGAVFVHSNITTGNTNKEGSKFFMNGGKITGCSATATSSTNSAGGGAVFVNTTPGTGSYVASVGLFELSNGIIENNTTKCNGGAVYSLGKFTMSNNSKISNNSTNNTGETLEDGLLVYTGLGGSIFIYKENAEFVMNDGTISKSIAASGGGIMVWTDSTFTMNGGTISNCKSLGKGGMGNGGAVYVQASTFNFNEGVLEENYARRYGGAININQSAKLYLNGNCDVLDNEANHGGGISQEAGDCQIQLDNKDILIKGNKAIGSSNNGNGGGLFIEKGVLNIIAGEIIGNSATNNGGGIALRVSRIGGDITVNMTGGTLEDNEAGVNGGALDIYADYTFTSTEETTDTNRINDVVVNLKDGILNGNSADKNGGAINIYVNEANGTAVMNIGATNYTAPQMEENTAKENGGAICINNGSVNITKGIINSCIATNGGGGAIYISGGDFTMDGGSIGEVVDEQKNGSKASKGGAIYVTGGNFTMNDGEIIGNTATESGGGIQISDGNVYITGGLIEYNLARGEASDAGYGGGIFVDGGEVVKITGGEISHNIAAKNGGGIEIKTDKTVTVDIYSGMFFENMAEGSGGAVGVDCNNGTINVGKQGCDGLSTSSHSHPIILDNIAGVAGGGFYTTGTSAILNIYCGTIDNNLVDGVESNFEQTNGIVTVYQNVKIGTNRDGIVVVGGSFIDKNMTDLTQVKITYVSNFNGSTATKEAEVTVGTEITLPGDIFAVEDYEVLGWTEDVTNPTVNQYDKGEKFKVTQETVLYAVWYESNNEPTILVIIPAEIKLNEGQSSETIAIDATVSLFPRTKKLNVNIVTSDFTLKLKNNEEILDEIEYILYKDEEELVGGETILELYTETTLLEYNKTSIVELELIDSLSKYSGTYEDSITFEVEVIDI